MDDLAEFNNLVKNSLSGQDYDIALVLSKTDLCFDKSIGKHILITTGDDTHKIWCYFKNHRWSYNKNTSVVQNFISKEFVSVYEGYRTQLKYEMFNIETNIKQKEDDDEEDTHDLEKQLSYFKKNNETYYRSHDIFKIESIFLIEK